MEYGDYRVVEELGRGGMGAVYRAQNRRSSAQVALKVLLAGANAPQVARARFEREARALVRFRHPNVVSVLDAGSQDGVPWIALELVHGESLDVRLTRAGPLPVEDVLRIGVDLAGALSHCHAQGLLHRDLKPANVLLRESDGAPLLTDFGLARELEPADRGLTRTGVMVGTPGFWSPEQVGGQGAEVGPPSDVYGLAATLYALLTGRPPHQGATLLELLRASEQPPPPASRARPEVSPQLDALLLSCLARDPLQRPDLTTFHDRLLALRGAPRRRGAQGLFMAASAALFVAAAVAVAVAWGAPAGGSLPAGQEAAPVATIGSPPVDPAALPPSPLPAGLRQGAAAGEFLHDLPAGGELRMVWVPPGAFLMGCADGEPTERPVHRVQIARGFFLARFELTWGQYLAFCRATGREPPEGEIVVGTLRYRPADDVAAYRIGWEDAQAYCTWAGLRLPSEAEWEWAARGPRGTRYPWGEHAPLGRLRLGNVLDVTGAFLTREAGKGLPARWAEGYDDGALFPTAVGLYPAGASWCGAEDMAGNVSEWVQDTWHPSYEGAPADGSPWELPGAAERVDRGGGWEDDDGHCRSTARFNDGLDEHDRDLGLRPAR